MLRVVVALNSLVLGVYYLDDAEHPLGVVVCLVVLAAWTVAAGVLYAVPARRGPLLLGADLAVALGLLVATPLVKGPDFEATVPGFWLMSALVAWAVHYRWVGGLVAGVVLATVDLALREDWSQSNYGNAFLLVIGGPVIGFVSSTLQRLAEERDQAQRESAAAAERARLARAVHDGVLQVLALVQRRGAELGGDAAELGRLAGEQEATLRALIHAQDAVRETPGAVVDLADRLDRLSVRPGVQVATPGDPVRLPAERAAEVVAVVAACLDNVERHVGAGAAAWVLLEDLGDVVEVSVRDEGPGIDDGRLATARDEGRLGVSESICGRVADLGGTAALETGDGGTEWTFTVPREARGGAVTTS